MLIDYLPILVLFPVAVSIASVVIVASSFLGPQRLSRRKLMPYESGIGRQVACYKKGSQYVSLDPRAARRFAVE